MGQAEVCIGEVLGGVTDSQVGEAGIDFLEGRSLRVRSSCITWRWGFTRWGFGGGRHASLLFVWVSIRLPAHREAFAERHIGNVFLRAHVGGVFVD